MKIIKYGMIAVIGAFFLPAPPDNEFIVSNTGQRINLETGEVLAAAASTYSDVSNFCVRQTAVCNTAGQVWTSLENKAKYNFQRVYEWSNGTKQDQIRIPTLPPMPQQQISLPGNQQQNGQENRVRRISIQQVSQVLPKRAPFEVSQLRPDLILTGSVRVQMANAQTTNKNTTNTLQIEDLIPEWRGPVLTGTG